MLESLFAAISAFIIGTIKASGYLGIVALMGIESACIPLPSEVIMPFSGYLVSTGHFNLWLCGLAGALGCLLGSWAAYWVGAYGGRPLVERYGKYVLLSHRDLDRADAFFGKYGDITVFISRLLPVIRTFISLPAGISKMNFWKFSLYTFVGSFPWCLGLAYVGKVMGDNWEVLRVYFHKFDAVIFVGLLVLFGLFLWGHLKRER